MGHAGNRKEDGGGAMTDEEREKKIVALTLHSLEIVERDSDRRVKATFTWGVRYADISMEAAHTALWDILRQIPELR